MAGMSITRRAARFEDMPFLTDCFVRAMRESITACRGQWDEARERAQFEHQLDLGTTEVIRAAEADIGFVVCVQGPHALQIHTLCIVPEQQGRGIGSHVTVDLVASGRQLGHDVVLSVLKSNRRAEAFYRRLGFRVVDESEHHHHMKHHDGAS